MARARSSGRGPCGHRCTSCARHPAGTRPRTRPRTARVAAPRHLGEVVASAANLVHLLLEPDQPHRGVHLRVRGVRLDVVVAVVEPERVVDLVGQAGRAGGPVAGVGPQAEADGDAEDVRAVRVDEDDVQPVALGVRGPLDGVLEALDLLDLVGLADEVHLDLHPDVAGIRRVDGERLPALALSLDRLRAGRDDRLVKVGEVAAPLRLLGQRLGDLVPVDLLGCVATAVLRLAGLLALERRRDGHLQLGQVVAALALRRARRFRSALAMIACTRLRDSVASFL